MYITVAILLSSAQGALFGALFGLTGLFISVPIGIALGLVGAELQAKYGR